MNTIESSSPHVQICLPVQKLEPFPTLYWLSDPKWDKKIATLEAGGAVKKMRAWITEDESRASEYKKLQVLYRDQRRSFIKLDEMKKLPIGGRKRIWETGIGGMEDWSLVRCLHMQYAFHLIHPNFVGKKIEEWLSS